MEDNKLFGEADLEAALEAIAAFKTNVGLEIPVRPTKFIYDGEEFDIPAHIDDYEEYSYQAVREYLIRKGARKNKIMRKPGRKRVKREMGINDE